MPHDDSGSSTSGFSDELGGDPVNSGGSNDGYEPEPDPSPGPSTGGGSPSFPGGSDPGPADNDPDPSPGPSTGGGSPSFPGGSDPEPPEPEATTIDRVTGGVSDVVDSGIDAGQNVVSDVQGGVDRVSDTLPGATGTAFAAGAGVAAIPEPTPVTETTGAAIAGGAALVGGGILASRALRNRGGELDVGERVQNELDVGQSRRDVTEVEPGTRVGSELEPGAAGPTTTEVGTGATVSGSEIDVPSATSGGFEDTLGIGATGVQIGREEQPGDGQPTITRDDLIGEEPDIDQPGPSIREQQRREELTAPERDFPTGESTVIGRQTASEIADQVQEPSIETTATGFGTGVGVAGVRDPLLGGNDRADEDVTGVGIDPTSLGNTFGTPGSEPDAPIDTGTGTEGGTETGTGTEPVQEPLTATTVVNDVMGTQPQTEAVETTAEQFANPEVTAFESPTVEATAPGTGVGNNTSRRPRDPDPEEESDDEPVPVGFGFDADDIDSGLLSGDEAADDVFGDLRF